jgi:hypothetical protein
MGKKHSMNARVLFAIVVLSLVAPAVAAAQGAGTGVSVQGAFGSHIKGGGNTQTLSVGYSPDERIGFLLSAERLHLPTEIKRYEHGFGATRGGTTTFISGEVRLSPFMFNRMSPYGLVGVGRGISRPNVNDIFPDPVKRNAALLFAGGGVRLTLTERLSAFADMRFMLQVDRTETGVFLFLPVRGGVAWTF